MARWSPDAPGRLREAALELYAEQGYEATTVADIAARAGLTKRTYFRYFADKREVLFDGSVELQRRWVDATVAAPADAGALEAVVDGLTPVVAMFSARLSASQIRAGVVDANPELRERELIKLQTLAGALRDALESRRIETPAAILAAQAGVTIFHVAFTHWVAQDDPAAFGPLVLAARDELRAVAAG